MLMLIGIVKKNAIMMIDFALARSANRAWRRRGDPAGVPAALPPDHDDHVRRRDGPCRWRWAWAPAPNCASRWAWPWWAACCSRR
jgi:hypothetical protein